jgi:hypothetical protein
MASYQPFLLQLVQDWIQGSLGNLECAIRASPQFGRDRIAVQRTLLENREQKTIELSLEALHTSIVYALAGEASMA